MSKLLAKNGKIITKDGEGFILPDGLIPQALAWQQTPSAVQNYLDSVDYSGVTYDTSDVQEYATASVVPALAIGKAITVDAGTLLKIYLIKTIRMLLTDAESIQAARPFLTLPGNS